MRHAAVVPEDLRGVFPVPPLARKSDARRSIDFEQNDRLVRYMAASGMTRFLYGGNAFLYHIPLGEYEQLLDWLSTFRDEHLAIPSAGPSYGRAMDQAPLLRNHDFPCVMLLPCSDPRDAAGLERGIREIADAVGTKLILYVKDETNFGADREAGLNVIGRLVADGLCVAIKYAVVRADPAQDVYLEALLKRVDRNRVISGIGERPAVAHMRKFGLPGFTTGSGCVAPAMSNGVHQACSRGDYAGAEKLRAEFLPLEDLRDAWGPSRVLHAATELAGLAVAGPMLPFLSPLTPAQMEKLAPVAQALAATDARYLASRAEAALSPA